MDLNDANDKDRAQGDGGAINSDLIRGHINTIILRTLYDGDKYGYEIISEIEEKSKNQYVLKQPTLYSALKRLESQDYVTSYWGGVSNGGRRKYFQITDKGRKVVEQNRAEWEYSRTVIDSLISERDYDFNNPPPAGNIDFSLLKKSTSRVPASNEEEADDIELAAPETEAATAAAEQPKEPVLAGWTREDPLEAVRAAEPEPQEEPAPAAPAEEIKAEEETETVKKEPAAEQAAPKPTIITQEASARWTREHPLESVATEAEPAEKADYDRTLEGEPAADAAESGEGYIEETRPLTEEERQRIHENYRNLIGDEEDATSYYYSQVAKSRSARPSYETQSGGGSSRTAGYTMDQYAAQNDLYAEEAQQMYEPEMPAPARYEEAYRQNKAISSELLYSDKSPEERNYKDLLSKLYDNTRHEYDDYEGYGSYGGDPEQNYDNQNYGQPPQEASGYGYPQETYYDPEEQPVPPQQPEQPKSVKAAPEMSAPKSETKEKSAGSTSSASEASKRPAPKAKEETAVEKKAKSDGLRVAAAREARPQAAEEPLPPGKTFDRGKVLLMTAIWVFCVALVESIVNACLIGVLNSGVAYVVIPFILDFLFIGAFLLLYLRGFGKNSRRSSSTSYISASFVIFANIVLIVCLIAKITKLAEMYDVDEERDLCEHRADRLPDRLPADHLLQRAERGPRAAHPAVRDLPDRLCVQPAAVRDALQLPQQKTLIYRERAASRPLAAPFLCAPRNIKERGSHPALIDRTQADRFVCSTENAGQQVGQIDLRIFRQIGRVDDIRIVARDREHTAHLDRQIGRILVDQIGEVIEAGVGNGDREIRTHGARRKRAVGIQHQIHLQRIRRNIDGIAARIDVAHAAEHLFDHFLQAFRRKAEARLDAGRSVHRELDAVIAQIGTHGVKIITEDLLQLVGQAAQIGSGDAEVGTRDLAALFGRRISGRRGRCAREIKIDVLVVDIRIDPELRRLRFTVCLRLRIQVERPADGEPAPALRKQDGEIGIGADARLRRALRHREGEIGDAVQAEAPTLRIHIPEQFFRIGRQSVEQLLHIRFFRLMVVARYRAVAVHGAAPRKERKAQRQNRCRQCGDPLFHSILRKVFAAADARQFVL